MTRLSRFERPAAPVSQAINLSARELAKRADFDRDYALGLHPAMQAVERTVCGCTYGSTAGRAKTLAKAGRRFGGGSARSGFLHPLEEIQGLRSTGTHRCLTPQHLGSLDVGPFKPATRA